MNKSLILVVEDDTSVRNLITTTLKAHEYRYLTAPDGQSAILEASSHNPDIVLLDLGLPDMDGVEIIKKIRTWSNMPIIVISARSEDTDKIDALDAGADDYLTKPFSVEELLARLRVTQRRLSMMQKVSPAEAVVFVNGKLRVDYAACCAYLNVSGSARSGRVRFSRLWHGCSFRGAFRSMWTIWRSIPCCTARSRPQSCSCSGCILSA